MTPTSACLATLGSWVTTATSAARRWPDAGFGPPGSRNPKRFDHVTTPRSSSLVRFMIISAKVLTESPDPAST